MQNKRNINIVSQTSNKDKSVNSNQDYNHRHEVINHIRQETFLNTPPKDTLSYLIFKNSIEELKTKLTKENIDANIRDLTGETHSWTPLYWSVKLRRLECIQILLDYGVDINIVVHDEDECFGTVLDLATLRDDEEIEDILREYAEKEDVNMGRSFKAIRTKLRGKAPAFNFRYVNKEEKLLNG